MTSLCRQGAWFTSTHEHSLSLVLTRRLQDRVLPIFGPTVLLFLAGSSAYGVNFPCHGASGELTCRPLQVCGRRTQSHSDWVRCTDRDADGIAVAFTADHREQYISLCCLLSPAVAIPRRSPGRHECSRGHAGPPVSLAQCQTGWPA